MLSVKPPARRPTFSTKSSRLIRCFLYKSGMPTHRAVRSCPFCPCTSLASTAGSCKWRHAVHAHLDAGQLTELFELPFEFLVGGGNEVRERDQSELAVLPDGRRRFGEQHAGDPGRGCQR